MYGDITFTQYCSLFRRASHQLSLQYLSFGDKNWEYSLLIHERKIYPSKISMAKNKPVKCPSDIIQKCWWLILCRTNYESRLWEHLFGCPECTGRDIGMCRACLFASGRVRAHAIGISRMSRPKPIGTSGTRWRLSPLAWWQFPIA